MEYLDDPYEFTVTYPFGHNLVAHDEEEEEEEETPTPGPSAARKRKAPETKQKKGRQPSHSNIMRKYSPNNMPPYMKKRIFKNWPLKNVMQNKAWKKAFINLESCSLAASTWKKYLSALNTFQTFCEDIKIPITWPIKENQKLGFIIWCHETRNLSHSTVKTYLTSLSTLSHMLVFTQESEGNNKMSKLLLKGMENAKISTAKPMRKTDPLTFKILNKLRKAVKRKNWKALSKKTIWTACCVGYFGSFRAGELLPKAEWKFDKFSDLLWSDVKDTGKDTINIHVKCPKTGTKGGEFIEIFQTPDKKYCPVRAIRSLGKTQKTLGLWSESLPVFRFASGKNLTVAKFSHILRKMFKGTKLEGMRLSAKSMRAGIPTDMESFPDLINDCHIKIWGRWKGKSYLRYMKGPPKNRKWIFEKICQALF